jgi:hypothetical protein
MHSAACVLVPRAQAVRCVLMGPTGPAQLREFDRCRTLYEKYLEHNPANVYAWIKYAELEKLLEEVRGALRACGGRRPHCGSAWVGCAGRRTGAAPCLSWPSASHCSTCPSSSGRPTSVSTARRAPSTHTYIHTHIHTYIHIVTYIHTCIYAYTHTCIQSYVHVYTPD